MRSGEYNPGTDPAGPVPGLGHYARPFAFRKALATAAGVFLSTATALFIAIIAAFVSFALTAFTAVVNFEPSAETSAFDVTGATFWNPKICLLSISAVYLPVANAGSVVKMSPPVTRPWSISFVTGIVPSWTNLIFVRP